jgi:hypothetical protein
VYEGDLAREAREKFGGILSWVSITPRLPCKVVNIYSQYIFGMSEQGTLPFFVRRGVPRPNPQQQAAQAAAAAAAAVAAAGAQRLQDHAIDYVAGKVQQGVKRGRDFVEDLFNPAAAAPASAPALRGRAKLTPARRRRIRMAYGKRYRTRRPRRSVKRYSRSKLQKRRAAYRRAAALVRLRRRFAVHRPFRSVLVQRIGGKPSMFGRCTLRTQFDTSSAASSGSWRPIAVFNPWFPANPLQELQGAEKDDERYAMHTQQFLHNHPDGKWNSLRLNSMKISVNLQVTSTGEASVDERMFVGIAIMDSLPTDTTQQAHAVEATLRRNLNPTYRILGKRLVTGTMTQGPSGCNMSFIIPASKIARMSGMQWRTNERAWQQIDPSVGGTTTKHVMPLNHAFAHDETDNPSGNRVEFNLMRFFTQAAQQRVVVFTCDTRLNATESSDVSTVATTNLVQPAYNCTLKCDMDITTRRLFREVLAGTAGSVYPSQHVQLNDPSEMETDQTTDESATFSLGQGTGAEGTEQYGGSD